MSHGPEHQIEHAEHAAHAVYDNFNRKVTISIAGTYAICFQKIGMIPQTTKAVAA